ncbi:MAG TPA: glycosyltransferase family 39 protein [Rhodocyclaceae bacterium]|nr:glycosyltransferase family 39 protein [Rhodocyclaceae bacterium]
MRPGIIKPLHAADLIALTLLLALVALLFVQAPGGGAFAWSDAPRHALNGVFVKDFVAAMPWDDPAGYAYRYYAQYPALTILFYPPLFYVISAPFYALFGFSHGVALLVVGLHYAAFASACYRISRRWFDAPAAVLLAALIVVLPEIAFWGRQIMLEIPALAFLAWSAACFLDYLDERRPLHLYLAVALLVLAMYSKISVGFMALAYAASLMQAQGGAAWRNRHHYLAALAAAFALLPLLLLTVKFGQANVQSVTGVADASVSRATLDGWLWYARQLPLQMGWPALPVVLAGLALLSRAPAGARRAEQLFLALWFACGYLFFSAIDLKESRHTVFILPPLVFLGALGLRTVLSGKRLSALLLVLLLATLAWTALKRPVHYVDGYREAADKVADMAPPNSAVLFSGYRDGAFVFNMRVREDRRDLMTVRADKLLLKVAVRRELGVEQKSYTEAEIARMLDEAGVHYVVAQQDFWTDLEVMASLQRVLNSEHFSEVGRVQTRANYPVSDKLLLIYRNNGRVSGTAKGMDIELPIIQRTIPAGRSQ